MSATKRDIYVMSNNETAYKLFNVIITTSALHIAFKILSDVDDVLFTTIYRECTRNVNKNRKLVYFNAIEQ